MFTEVAALRVGLDEDCDRVLLVDLEPETLEEAPLPIVVPAMLCFGLELDTEEDCAPEEVPTLTWLLDCEELVAEFCA